MLDRRPHRQVHSDQGVAVDVFIGGTGVDAVAPDKPGAGLGVSVRLVDEILEGRGERMTERMPETRDVELRNVNGVTG